MSTLYVVATPIGNLEDITLRALRVLAEVALIAAEDTRHTRKLLSHARISTPLLSFHEHSSSDRVEELVGRLDFGNVALVSDAGTPGVSDPGAALVAAAIDAGHDVVPVPGPSAVTAALSASGMPADSYLFLGFPPRRAKDRAAMFRAVATEARTMVVFEAPHRIVGCLEDMVATLGEDRVVAVTREMTKKFEDVWRGTVGEAVQLWTGTKPRGEFTVVVAGAELNDPVVWDNDTLLAAVDELRKEGVGAREGAKRLAGESGLRSRDIYRMWHENDPMEGQKP